MMSARVVQIVLFVVIALALRATAVDAQTDAEARLAALNPDLEPHFEELVDGVYVASGYGVSTIGFIVGDDGIVAIDAGAAQVTTAKALEELRTYSDAPVVAVILTHGHGDHTGGLPAFLEPGQTPQVWARANFGVEGSAFAESGITYAAVRGRRQAGFLLPMEMRINNGIAPAMPPGGGAPRGFQTESKEVQPDRLFAEDRIELHIGGVTLQLVAAPGETDDQLYVWYPEGRVIFSGDNLYKSWPNLYAIRGTPYRDVKKWSDAVNMMLGENPEFLVPGHTRAISGADQVAGVLATYRDGIRHVFDKTIEGINLGMTPDELVEYAKLPESLAGHPYLQPYYGHPDWAVRSIFTGYLGWFDGNPTNLHRYSTKDHARRVASLAGGVDRLLEEADSALNEGDAQWAAELCDYLLALGEHEIHAMLIKSSALESLGRNSANALARNYYLTVAQELRRSAEKKDD